MDKRSVLVTGAAGFIGSVLVWALNNAGWDRILVADDFGMDDKWKNLRSRKVKDLIHKDKLISSLDALKGQVAAVFHMGACSSTDEKDVNYLIENNFHYSVELFNFCVREKIPFIYASSAATYGMGTGGFDDREELIHQLRPLNPYGFSKLLFDQWVLNEQNHPPFWAGLRFFNVYGPNEYHKGKQASVAFHAYPQVKAVETIKLFKSYRSDCAHGEQKRDFVYVKDVAQVMMHLWDHSEKITSGQYNVGSGQARTFKDLGNAVFTTLKKQKNKFDWIEMPPNLVPQYQYFTEAKLDKLRKVAKYEQPFTTLEDGVADYINNYLSKEDPYL